MNPIPYAVVLAVLAVIVVVLLIYRHSLTANEDDAVHIVEGEGNIVAEQAERAKKLTVVDRWGKILTAIVVLGSITLLVIYVYLTYIVSRAVRMG